MLVSRMTRHPRRFPSSPSTALACLSPRDLWRSFLSRRHTPSREMLMVDCAFRAHGPSFNTSIWHISLSGITEATYVEKIRTRHQEVPSQLSHSHSMLTLPQYRENVALRQIVKHLRQQPGFQWDENTQMVTALAATWDVYISVCYAYYHYANPQPS